MGTEAPADAIIGTWEVHAPDAPFPWHVMTFTPYHTMSQSNPHEGNCEESDSSGHGVWERVADMGGRPTFLGKFVEFKADRAGGKHIGKGVILLRCTIDGDRMSGISAAYRYDETGKRIRGPLSSSIAGTRVVLSEADKKEFS